MSAEPVIVAFVESDAPHITARERLEIDRHLRAIAQAREAGLTGLRDAWTANA